MTFNLDRASNVAMLITCVIVSSVAIMRLTDVRPFATAAPSEPPYKVGEAMESINGIDYSKAPQTLVLFVRSSCTFCTDSMPLYQRISSSQRRMNGLLRVVAVSSEPVQITKAYLGIHSVNADEIVSVGAGQTRFNATPTLVVVDRAGAVTDVVVGKMSAERMRSFLGVIGTEVAAIGSAATLSSAAVQELAPQVR